MNDENDKILDELISYYDNVDDDFSGDTTMIPPIKSEEAPKDETLGDTMVVKPITPKEPIAEEATTEETTVINVPLSEEPQATINIPLSEEPEIPQDEVFGNLDIDGNIITTPQEDMMRRATQKNIPTRRPAQEGSYAPPRKTGLWYRLKPLWATIIVCIMLVASYMFHITDTGIIGIYKSNFAYNFSLIMRVFGVEYNPIKEVPIIGSNPFFITAYAEGEDPLYDEIDEKRASIPFTGADSASFEKYDKGVVCVKSNYMCYIDKNGDKKWELDTQISDPILSVSGKYIAIAGKDSTHLDLYKGKKLVYAVSVPDKIKACSVSEKGDVALVTDKSAYKGAVSVYNCKGEEVFSWISGVNYISSVAMLKSRNVAVSLVSTENSVKSFVMVFDIYDTDPINGTEITESLVFDSTPRKNTVYTSADNAISSINNDGELNYSVRFDGMDISHTATDKRGWRGVSFTEANLPYINVYNRSGDLYASTQIESIPDCMDLYKSVVLYNNGRDIICGVIDDTKTRYCAPMTVQKLILINKSTYMIVYENSLEIIKL